MKVIILAIRPGKTERYENYAEAADHFGVSKTMIKARIEDGKSLQGYTFDYIEEPDEIRGYRT